MSRLNVSYTVLSKRKLLKLVMNGFMRGWDDPRMPTIKGLRRRGYTPAIINAFCKDIGATRNANVVQYERLNAHARNGLHETSPRVMAVLQPLKLVISGRDLAGDAANITVPDFPFDPTRGSHVLRIENEVYIDRSDFRLEDSEDYFGLAPGKVVGLKYAFRVRCESVETNGSGAPVLLRCVALPDSDLAEDKPKGSIQWVPASTAVPIEVRIYNPLFTVEEPTDEGWEAELNPESEVVMSGALADPSIRNWKPVPEKHFQFERIGFFVIDRDTTADRLVANMTVNLKVCLRISLLWSHLT
jgi:glutaminyl-tRNA synthetase